MQKLYQAAVIGGGSAGIATLGTLFDNNVKPIFWIDPAFQGGRISRYHEVPSNTKVRFFIDYCTKSNTLNSFCRTCDLGDPIEKMKTMDPEITCKLTHVYDELMKLTNHFHHMDKNLLTSKYGNATKLVQNVKKDGWTLHFEPTKGKETGETSINTEKVFLAHGSREISLDYHRRYAGPKGMKMVDLITGLTPSQLAKEVSPDDTVCVIGGSHSAVLVLKNLYELPADRRPRVIKNIYREPYKHAVYLKDWIRYDNTGLKGEASDFAKEILESGKADFIQRIEVNGPTEAATLAKELRDVNKIIYGIGFQKNPIPEIILADGTKAKDVIHNPTTGALIILDKDGHKIENQGLFGYGIAFPEQVTDREGNVEWSVGLIKFMNYLQRVMPKNIYPKL